MATTGVATLVIAAAVSWWAVQGGVWPIAMAAEPWFGVGKWAAVVAHAVIASCWLAPAVLAVLGYGAAVRRWCWPRLPWSATIATGAAVWGWLGLTIATLGGVGAVCSWGLVAVGWAAGVAARRELIDLRARTGGRTGAGLTAWCGIGLGLLAVGAACPPGSMWRVEALGYDTLSYHLQLPREWLAAGRLSGLDHSVYSHLPSLVESMMMQVAALRGGGADGVLPSAIVAQWLHVGFALLTAWCLGDAVRLMAPRDRRAQRSGGMAGTIVAAAWLVVPWVVVLGSLAYNEMAVTAFAAAACMMLLAWPRRQAWRWLAIAVLGVVLASAVLAKPTAGPMVAVPLGLAAMLISAVAASTGDVRRRLATALHPAAILLVVGLLLLSPYFARNAVQRGNPVFPFAGELLGHGHWDTTLADRWDRAHGLDPQDNPRSLGSALWRQWLGNQGYGAFGGRSTPPERDNVARFTLEGGLPIFWLLATAGAVIGLCLKRCRFATIGCMAWLAWQLAFWAFATHLQSRFLVVTLVPGSLLIGVGLSALLRALPDERRGPAAWIAAAAIVLPIATVADQVIRSQPAPAIDADGRLLRDPLGRVVPVPVAMAVDAWPLDARAADTMHPVNALPPDTRTLVVADNARLLYLNRPFAYATPFDPNPLGQLIRDHGPDAADITAALRDAGFTHVYLGVSELNRLHRTYGFDPDVTLDTLGRLVREGRWRQVAPQLYALPGVTDAGAGAG